MLRTIVLLSVGLLAVMAATKCDHQGKKMNDQEVITVQNAFRVKCFADPNGSWRTDIVGCVARDGTIIESGEKKTVGDRTYHCVKTPGGVSLQQTMAGTSVSGVTGGSTASGSGAAGGCRAKDGSNKKVGEEYVEGNFVRKCEATGFGNIIGCKAKDVATTIPLNKTTRIGKMEYKCVKNGDAFSYNAYSV